MRRPSSFLRKSPIELNMTPMIDCVFLLMVYFIWASSFVSPEFFLPGRLSAETASGGPTASVNDPPPPEKDFDDVIIRITRPGGTTMWRVNDADVGSLPQLHEQLSRVAKIKTDAPVIVHPDDDVPAGDVIDVFDTARLVGFVQIQFAVSEKP